MTLDMKLQQKSSDILICIDRLDEKNTSELKNCVLEWEGGQTRYLANPLPANLSGEDDPGIARLNESIDGYLPSDVAYNVDFYFYDNYNNPKGYRTMNIIKHGDPGDNSVKVRKLVTINKDDDIPGNSFWSDSRNNRYPEIVEVQLTAWYL
ncbi:hypothetical protein RCIX375 [Methanocella arvoryzae MRE50]|uniref:Uncharacterized protein n=2 Tax=Methanocella TaxID=570266 RepID=Q0W724_METAR|nr:hypothetical protein RCIX375 [Methanocella arvoryzae MRE50]